MPIPNFFNNDHVLNPGTYDATFADIQSSILVQGCGSPNWDVRWRAYLVKQLHVLVRQLWKVGVTEIFIDGSFVEEKDHPGDIDGYFEVDINVWPQQLFRLNSSTTAAPIWDWRLIRFPGKVHPMLAMKYHYNIELFPHIGQNSGIPGPNGYDQTFPQAFRRSRTGKDKGIIKLIKQGDPNDKN